jgi:hypothetical protein
VFEYLVHLGKIPDVRDVPVLDFPLDPGNPEVGGVIGEAQEFRLSFDEFFGAPGDDGIGEIFEARVGDDGVLHGEIG